MTDAILRSAASTRRDFCSHGCLAAAATLSALAAGCGGSSPTSPGRSGTTGTPLPSVNATVSGRTVSIPVDGSALAVVGGAALARTSVGTFLLARTGQDTFSALTATCTHEGTTITNFTGSQFACPAHGSMFTTAGTVAQGPATRPLTTYPTTFASGMVSFVL